MLYMICQKIKIIESKLYVIFNFLQKNLGSERTKLGSERTKLGSERTKLGSERTKLGSERTKLGSERTILFFCIQPLAPGEGFFFFNHRYRS